MARDGHVKNIFKITKRMVRTKKKAKDITPIEKKHEQCCQPLTTRPPPIHPCNVVFNLKSPLGDTKPKFQESLELNPATPQLEDPHTLNDLPPETPHQEGQRCTRNHPYKMQNCMIYDLPHAYQPCPQPK